MFIIFNLSNNALKGWGWRVLVNKSASWSLDLTRSNFKTYFLCFPLTMWQSIFKCLVLSWKIGLDAMWLALWLSRYITFDLVHVTCKAFMRYKRHWSSQVAAARARYSPSDEDLESVNCLFVLHELRNRPRKKHWPEMDLCVSMQSTDSAFG